MCYATGIILQPPTLFKLKFMFMSSYRSDIGPLTIQHRKWKPDCFLKSISVCIRNGCSREYQTDWLLRSAGMCNSLPFSVHRIRLRLPYGSSGPSEEGRYRRSSGQGRGWQVRKSFCRWQFLLSSIPNRSANTRRSESEREPYVLSYSVSFHHGFKIAFFFFANFTAHLQITGFFPRLILTENQAFLPLCFHGMVSTLFDIHIGKKRL